MKKLAASVAFIVIMFVMFFATASASRRNIPVGLSDIYGDTSGLRCLTVEGTVVNWESRYAYQFSVSPDKSTVDMHVFTHRGDEQSYSWSSWPFPHWQDSWHPSFFEAVFTPGEPYEVLAYDSSRRAVMVNADGTETFFPEYRIYGDVFAVETRMHGFTVLTATSHSLFADAGTDGYIYAFTENAPYFHFSAFFNGRERHHSFHNIFPITNSLVIGDLRIFVHTGPDLFGETAVYGVCVREGRVPTVPLPNPDDGIAVEALTLLPVTLARGEDEIIGLLGTDEGFLLIIQRADRLEITHYIIESGEAITAEIGGVFRFDNTFQRSDAAVFFVMHWNGDKMAWEEAQLVFNIKQNAFMSDVRAFALGGEQAAAGTHRMRVYDAFARDGMVYFIYTLEANPWAVMNTSVETFISAFDMQGRLIGRAQVLNGVEDDRYWLRRGGGMEQAFARRIQSLSIK
ncbi:MAG: hypothetical protein FWD90_10980 [Defluviitaleaceae bacterium]|nr:hypothetical protein [Defluviitaleaceae bacterium]